MNWSYHEPTTKLTLFVVSKVILNNVQNLNVGMVYINKITQKLEITIIKSITKAINFKSGTVIKVSGNEFHSWIECGRNEW